MSKKDENASIYLNKIIDLRTQLVGCGCNWINDKFMVFIILQSLSSKFSNFVIVIETRLNDEEEVFSLHNLYRLLLKNEETLNNKVSISSPKDNNIALGATKTPSKKNSKHHKNSSCSFRNFKKKGNSNKNNHGNYKQKGRSTNPNSKERFDKNYNFYGIYGQKEFECHKKKSAKKCKGNENGKYNKKKKNKNSTNVAAFYSMSQTISNDWIVDSGCTNHMCCERNKFENFYEYKKDAIVIGDNSTLNVQRIGSVLIVPRSD